MSSLQNPEADLIDSLKALWHGKWIIVAVALTAGLVGSLVFKSTPYRYEARVYYSIDNIPPETTADQISNKFQKLFYSASTFERWSEKNVGSAITFNTFNESRILNGILVDQESAKQIATFEMENNVGTYILIKSGNLSILTDFFSYANHTNALLSQDLLRTAKRQKKQIEFAMDKSTFVEAELVKYLAAIDDFIASVEVGGAIFKIRRPSIPSLASISFSQTLVISLLFGILISSLLIIIRRAIQNR
jgi:hypothetical protein